MRALVTGANGFAGTHLVRLLMASGWQVFGITNDLALNPDLRPEGVDFRLEEVDVCCKEDLCPLLEEFRPEFVFHLAAITKNEATRDAVRELYRVNLEGTQNLLFSLAETGVEATTLVTGSSAIYGSSHSSHAPPLSEEATPCPETVYGASKLAQEHLAIALARARNLKVVVTRSFNYTGPGEGGHMACSAFARQIAECEKKGGGWVEVGNLESYRDYCDVRDVVKAYVLVAAKAKTGSMVNVCSGRAVQMKDVLAGLISLSRVKVEVRVDSSRLRVADTSFQRGDNTKIKRLAGWEPSIAFERTLSDLLDFWRDKLSTGAPR